MYKTVSCYALIPKNRRNEETEELPPQRHFRASPAFDCIGNWTISYQPSEMNFLLRRYDNRALLKDDPDKLHSKRGDTVKATETGNENDPAPLSTEDPSEYEMDLKNNASVTPLKQSSEKKVSEDLVTPRLFQRKLFQKTPPKTSQKDRDEESQKQLEVSTVENGTHLVESATERKMEDVSIDQSENMIQSENNEPNQDAIDQVQDMKQSDLQPAPQRRTLESWENWDEDFYSLLSTSAHFVSTSAMTFASVSSSALSLASQVYSKLTDDFSEKENEESKLIHKNTSTDSTDMSEYPSLSMPSDSNHSISASVPTPSKTNASSTAVSDSNVTSNPSIEEKYNNVFTLNFIKVSLYLDIVSVMSFIMG